MVNVNYRSLKTSSEIKTRHELIKNARFRIVHRTVLVQDLSLKLNINTN